MNTYLTKPAVWPLLLLLIVALTGCISNPFREPETAETGARVTERILQHQPAEAEAIELKPAKSMPKTLPHVVQNDLPPDLWERIRRGFRMPMADNPRIRHQVKWLEAHPNHLRWTSERALPYLHYIVEQVEQRGLPMELALLPAIESGFRPQVHSRYQAAGLWQFIPSTAGAFGLKQTWWYDGRCDITASTQAAFDYLQHLADQFEGDWLLTLAAYNAGPSLLRRAIERNRKEGLPTDYWSLDLPLETQSYLPRLLAVVQVVKQPAKHGIELTPIPNQVQFSSVELQRQIDLRLAADLAGMDQDELKRLNPGLLRWATDPDGPHRLLLPQNKAEVFAEKLAALPPEQWITLKRYRIRHGDSLSGIAQRHGVELADLKRLNKLSDSKILIGHHLLIPTSGPDGDSLADAGPNPKTTQHSHVVKPGDTLWDIARNYKLNLRQLATWNELARDHTLWPGQVLKLKGDASSKPLTYRVRNGDSLYLIARRYGVTVADLKRWNRLSGSYLRPGQKLTLYPKSPITTAL